MTQEMTNLEQDKDLKRAPEMTAQMLDSMPAKELTEKRERFTKVFSMEGNNYQAVTYTKPVHFKNERTGEWEEIDNTFILGRYKRKKCLRNRAGEIQVFCTTSGPEPFLHLVTPSGSSISYGVEGAAKVFPTAVANETAQAASESTLVLREKILKKQKSSVCYQGIFPDVDMVCTANADRLKDALVFHTPSAAREVAFCFDVHGAQMALDVQTNAITVTDDDNEVLFSLPAPFMLDAAGEKGEVQVSIEQVADKWSMRCTPDPEFLKAAAYPVVLDPAVYTQKQAKNIEDTYVRSNAEDTNYSTLDELWVCNNDTYGIRKSYLKVKTLPSIKAANYITKAYLCLSLSRRPEVDTAVFLSEVTSSFTTSELNYANRPTNNSLYQDYIYTSTSVPLSSFYQFDVSTLVRKWYANPSQNYGVVLTSQSPTDTPNTVRFSSMECDDDKKLPYLVVNYNSMAGLESYLSYDARSLGRAGDSNVSLYNGNLIFTHSDTSTNGSLLPVSVSHVYNSCDAQDDYWYMGYGWRTSMHLTLHRETIPNETGTNTVYYVYTDGDGTLHHFKPSESDPDVYEDLSGLSLKLTIDTASSTATMTDKGDNSTVFGLPTADRIPDNFSSQTKMVQRITDALKNTITVASTNLRINKITDGAGRFTTFKYDTNNIHCTSIQAPGQSLTECMRFGYDAAGNLTTITHEDNVVSTYTYNTNHLLLTAANADGRVITYTYENESALPTAGLPYRISEFSITNGSATDEIRGYEYGSRLTISRNLTYAGGKALSYHFNDYGNLVSVHDELGHASFTAFSKDGLPNHPNSVSRMQRVVTNLLRNPSIEDNTDDWVIGGTGDFLRDQTEYYIGLVSRKITITADDEATCGQTVALSPGSGYTFSAYVKTTGNVRAFLRVKYTLGGATQTVNSEPYYNLADFTRISLSFTLPSSASGTVTCYLVCNQYAGTAWFDCMQLENGLALNRYNLLQNSDFAWGGADTLPDCWDKDDTSSNNWYQPHLPADQPSFLTGRSVRLTGKHNRSVGFWQKFRAYGSEGDVYVAGGWTRGFGKEVATNADGIDTVRNYIKVFFGNGTDHGSPGGTIHFNYEEGNWQFACGAVKAPRDYTYIWFEIHFYQQMNYADFTNMFLYKEEFGHTFTYDQYGNIKNVSTLSGEKSSMAYDAFDNLTSYVQPGRASTVKTVMEYGATETEKKKHLLTKATDPMGVVQTFAYDDKGNQTEAQTKNSAATSFIKSTTDYTFPTPNYAVYKTDARGKTVACNTDWNKGTLNFVTDPNGQTVIYSYDALKRVTDTTAMVGSKTYKNEYVYNQDRLSQVMHNTDGDACDVVYNFEYDAFGKPTKVKVGTQALSTNTYNSKGLLTQVTYGNNGKVINTYDSFNRITGIRYDSDTKDRYTYSYNAEGIASHVTDTMLVRTHRLEYDLAGRPMRVTTRGSSSHIHTGELDYDIYNNLSAFTEKVGSGYTPYTTTFAYDNGNRPTTVQFGSTSNKVGYGYDSIGRVSTRTLTVGGTSYATTYGFAAGGHGSGSTTALVNSITQNGYNFNYTYDAVGNIASVDIHRDPGIPPLHYTYTVTDDAGNQVYGESDLTQPVSLQITDAVVAKITYQYDKLGQLIRVNDPYDTAAGARGTTWVYNYDRGGNIISKEKHSCTSGELGTPLYTFNYAYDATWKDKLISYDNAAITYDAIGNPLTDGTWTYEWQAGRQLESMTKTGTTATFAYNADGLRVRKSVKITENDTEITAVTDYTLHGKQVVHMKKGTDNLHFFYDAQGRPAVVDFNSVKYGYVHNLQGDVVAIIDGSGSPVVEYTYDAWGKQLSKTGTKAATLGALNPFRYRGYVFDEETGLYYLRSRYYNPTWGRFLNADTLLGTSGGMLSHNLFAYCANSPILCADADGSDFYVLGFKVEQLNFFHVQTQFYLMSYIRGLTKEKQVPGRPRWHADLYLEGKIWEVKPISYKDTGLGEAQLQRYVDNSLGQFAVGGSLLKDVPITFERYGFTFKLTEANGVIYYDIPRPQPEPVPVAEAEPGRITQSSPSTVTQSSGLLGAAAFAGITIGFTITVRGWGNGFYRELR